MGGEFREQDRGEGSGRGFNFKQQQMLTVTPV